MKQIIASFIAFVSVLNLFAQPADSTSSERRNNQNVMLNASAASQPRFISLGIPQWGNAIIEDGLPTAMFTDFFPGFWSWRSGLSTASMELTGLDESALQLGNIGYYPMSTSKIDTHDFEGAASFSMNHFGRMQVDLDIATPLGKGWSLNLNVYQDLNRGSNHLDMSYLQEHIQYYKAGLSRTSDKGRFFATYLYTKRFSVYDPYGPFIFIGDGSIKQYGDFELGRDQYLPATATYEFIDVMDGKKGTRRFVEDGGIFTHVITAGMDHRFDNGTTFNLSSRLRLASCNLTEAMLGSIEQESSNYTYQDGSPYSGAVQTRFLVNHQDILNEWFTTATLKGGRSGLQWNIGSNVWITWTDVHMVTSNFAYEAKKNPQHLLFNDSMYYVHNTGAQFVEGNQSKIAAFGLLKWNPIKDLSIRGGLRLEYSGIRGIGAHNIDGMTNNSRCEGWNLTMEGVSKTPFEVHNFNGAASMVANYRINHNWGLEINAVTTQQHAELWQYGEADLPTDKPKRNYLIRGGINFRNGWLDLQSLLMFYRQDNNYYTALWTHELTHTAGGYPAGYKESLYIGSLYSMQVLAWTTDIILKPFKGFTFHGLLTLRSPKYIDYTFQPTFSDGFSQKFDFSGKNITGSSAIEIELEPSYQIDKWRLWASARYYSRQYVNITNSLFFNPHWETFAGIDFTLNDHVQFTMNVINFLNQKGASAGIQDASLATDPTPFMNYLTAGTYLRPFTIEFGTNLKF